MYCPLAQLTIGFWGTHGGPGCIVPASNQAGAGNMASIEVRKRVHRDGGKYRVYRVIWRDPAGRKKSKTFGRKKPAERFARDVEHRKDVGGYIDPDLGLVTLAE